MSSKLRIAATALAASAIFFSGYAAGQNRFRQPKTIIHISLIKWKAGAADADKQKMLDGIKQMAAQIPGIKNIWTKPTRMQPRDYNYAFVIEFENREAADGYAESPVHAAWSKQLQKIREASISPQVSNE
jgi:antibiotic biosynthesis monooxygenase (ABM) superfamily enzyme